MMKIKRQRHGNDEHQAMFGFLHFLELAAPFGAVGGLEQRRPIFLGLGHGAGQIAIADAELHGDQAVALFAVNGRGAGADEIALGGRSCRCLSSGVTRSPTRRRGVAERLLNVPPNWLPVKAGMFMPEPNFDRPVLAPVSSVCGTAAAAAGDLVVGDVDGNVQDRLVRCCAVLRASGA